MHFLSENNIGDKGIITLTLDGICKLMNLKKLFLDIRFN